MPEVNIEFWGMRFENYGLITPEILSQYDAVVTIGKTVQYALGMGIPVYNYDHFGGNGWINLENFNTEARHNFSGRHNNRKILSQEIAHELEAGFSEAIEASEELRKKIADRCLLSIRMNQLLKMIEKSPISPAIDGKINALLMAYADSMVRWVYDRDSQNKSLDSKNRNIIKVIRELLLNKDSLAGNTIEKLRKIHPNKEFNKVSLFAVKDEERYLIGFFNHLRDYVDGFVVLDDGSTDDTPNIIKKESKVLSVMTNLPHEPED